MSDPFIGEVRMVAFGYPPPGWVSCHGQVLAIASYQALYSLLGTTYGGDGHSTFGVPDYRGRVPVGEGQGPGLDPVFPGQIAGSPHGMLEVAHLPKHSHEAIFTPEGGGGSSIEVDVDIDVANTTNNTLTDPVGNILATPSIPVGLGTGPGKLYAPPFEKTGKLGGVNVTVSGSGGSGGGTVIIGNTGGGNAFPIIQPFVGMRFIMATAGVYPPRP